MFYLYTFSNFANDIKVHVVKQEALDCHNHLVQGCTNFAKHRHHFKTLGCRSVTCSKVRAEDPKMIGKTLCSPGLVSVKRLGVHLADLDSVWVQQGGSDSRIEKTA